MDYTKKTISVDDQTMKPPTGTPVIPKAPVVQGGDQFPDTDTYKGQKVDSNYAPIDLEKDNIKENLRKMNEDTKARFGLDDRGV